MKATISSLASRAFVLAVGLLAILLAAPPLIWAVILVATWVDEIVSQREIRPYLEAIPEVQSFELFGGYEAAVIAVIQTAEGGPLELYGLSPESFEATGSVSVQQAGEFRVTASHCGPGGNGSGGIGFSLGTQGKENYLVSKPIAGVKDAVARYREILEVFAASPTCPESKPRLAAGTETQVRYCVYRVSSGLTRPKPNCLEARQDRP